MLNVSALRSSTHKSQSFLNIGEMVVLEHSFKDAHFSSNTSTAVSNQMAEWWQILRFLKAQSQLTPS